MKAVFLFQGTCTYICDVDVLKDAREWIVGIKNRKIKLKMVSQVMQIIQTMMHIFCLRFSFNFYLLFIYFYWDLMSLVNVLYFLVFFFFEIFKWTLWNKKNTKAIICVRNALKRDLCGKSPIVQSYDQRSWKTKLWSHTKTMM